MRKDTIAKSPASPTDRDPAWAILPWVATLIELALGAAAFWLWMLWHLNMVNCDYQWSAKCDRQQLTLEVAGWILVSSLVPWVLGWLWPQSYRFHRARKWSLLAVVGCLGLGLLVTFSTP